MGSSPSTTCCCSVPNASTSRIGNWAWTPITWNWVGRAWPAYGGIEQLQLAPGRLTLRFSSTLDWCRGLPGLDISWDAGLASVEEVRAALGEMLLGTDTRIQLQPGPGAPQ